MAGRAAAVLQQATRFHNGLTRHVCRAFKRGEQGGNGFDIAQASQCPRDLAVSVLGKRGNEGRNDTGGVHAGKGVGGGFAQAGVAVGKGVDEWLKFSERGTGFPPWLGRGCERGRPRHWRPALRRRLRGGRQRRRGRERRRGARGRCRPHSAKERFDVAVIDLPRGFYGNQAYFGVGIGQGVMERVHSGRAVYLAQNGIGDPPGVDVPDAACEEEEGEGGFV